MLSCYQSAGSQAAPRKRTVRKRTAPKRPEPASSINWAASIGSTDARPQPRSGEPAGVACKGVNVQPTDEDWRDEAVEALLDEIVALRDRDEAAAFLRDLCTLGEIQAMAQRWHVARLLDQGLHYAETSRLTGASTGTITRVAAWLHHGAGGYRRALDRRGGRAAAQERR